MTPALEALSETLRLDGYTLPYLEAVGTASRFTRLRQQTPRPATKRAEYKGRVDAYEHIAVLLLRESHGMDEHTAVNVMRRHIKEWSEAAQEDERWLREGA